MTFVNKNLPLPDFLEKQTRSLSLTAVGFNLLESKKIIIQKWH